MSHPPYCPICFSSFNTSKHIALPCECTCCHSCLTDWMSLKIREPSYSPNKTIRCFSQKCLGTFRIQAIYHLLPKLVREQIDKELLNSYLIKTSDIRKCPNRNCSYAGVIDLSAKCSQPLKCQACETTWRDPLHFSSAEKLLSVVSKTKTRRNEFFSSLWKGLWTKRCPGCQAPIQKTGGCAHMKCSSCETGFCWTCNGYHDNSKHALYFGISCIPVVIILIIAIYVIYQVAWVHSGVGLVMENFVRPLMRWCWYLICFLFLCLLCSILANNALVSINFLYQTFTKGPQKTDSRPLKLLRADILMCAILYFSSFPKFLLIIGLAEIPFILVMMLVGKRKRDANRQVYKTDWKGHDAKKQVYKADWKVDSRKQHWTERNCLKKSMKKVAYKFPSYRH